MNTKSTDPLLTPSRLLMASVAALVAAALWAVGSREEATKPTPHEISAAPVLPKSELATTSSRPVKESAARQAAELAAEGESAVQSLSLALSQATSKENKLIFADALTMIGSGDAIEQLLTRALEEQDNSLRRSISDSLSALTNPEGVETLASVVSATSDRTVLRAAIEALGRTANAETIDYLAELYRSDPNVRTQRNSIIRALAAVRNPEASRALASLMRTANEPGLVEAAGRSLSKIGNATAVQGLVDGAKRVQETDQTLHNSLINLTQRVDNPEGLAVLKNLDGIFEEDSL